MVIAKAVKAAAKIKKLEIPNTFESGAAIAKPMGRNNSEPMASNDETRESASRGTFV